MEIEEIEKKLTTTREVLGSLIILLQRELGTDNCEQLVKELVETEEEEEIILDIRGF